MNPRRAAYECLRAVDEDGAYANLEMPRILRRAGLSGRDAAFAIDLAYGTLRRMGWYDAVTAAAARRDPDGIEPRVRRTLWLGVHQALAMDVAPHAAVSETVDLVRAVGVARAAGFVNAVMRRVTEAGEDEWVARLAPGSGDADVALRHAHPEWVARGLREALVADGRADAWEDLLASHNRPPRVSLAVLPLTGAATRESFANDAVEIDPLSPVGLSLAGGAPDAVEGLAEGRVRVQDAGSQLAALALSRLNADDADGADQRWLDMCAGPGGKAALLGAEAARVGACLDAIEQHEHRAALVRRSVAAVPAGVVTVAAADAREWDGGPYDRVLLDAPCTGMGALRRRPEARWRRSPADLDDLVDLQRQLLGSAVRLTKSGGVIAYVTCSPLLAETRQAVAWAASAHNLVLEDARAVLARITQTTPERWGEHPAVQLWTDRDGTDSMFVALLRRR